MILGNLRLTKEGESKKCDNEDVSEHCVIIIEKKIVLILVVVHNDSSTVRLTAQ